MMRHARLTSIFLCSSVYIFSMPAEAEEKLDETAVTAAYDSVIRECNNLASTTDLKFAGELSKKPWTEKQKADVLAVTHNGFLQLCLLGVAANIKKYADSIDIKTSE